ncbi:hypothetical protein Misp01_51080 [Microtetraspora sp. NBRC 13810]|nr:chromate transporter [Microtetraspora sp. NBRC 13810]GLW09979.1 hypothetical protein Misp01_51080 [Microtetraspora sp. NBRC 13810]
MLPAGERMIGSLLLQRGQGVPVPPSGALQRDHHPEQHRRPSFTASRPFSSARSCATRWIRRQRFNHALNYCMLLPGPEGQQLAIDVGWVLNGTRGGLVAGTLFALPACWNSSTRV